MSLDRKYRHDSTQKPTLTDPAYSFRSREPRRETREPARDPRQPVREFWQPAREHREPMRDRREPIRKRYDDYPPEARHAGRPPRGGFGQPRNRDDYSDYNRNDRGRRSRPEPRRGRDPRNKGPPELAESLKARLKSMEKVPSLDQVPLENSKWGVRGEGFEQVLAVRAKLSGLFPLPGYPRPRDYTKLYPSVRSKLPYFPEDPDGQSQIEPYQALAARTLLIDINFSIDVQVVADHLAAFLRSLDLELTGLDVVKSTATNRDILIVEFKNNECATIALAFHGQPVHIEHDGSVTELVLSISRPAEYVVQDLGPSPDFDKVIDSPRKIALGTALDSETELKSALESIHPVNLLAMLRETGTKKFKGIAFVEFIETPEEILEKVRSLDVINWANFSCKGSAVQVTNAEFENFKRLAKADGVDARSPLKCIVLANMFLPRELYDETNYKFILDDVRQEAEQLGGFVSLKIPRPDTGNEPGVGKAYLEFESAEAASSAMDSLAGRFYNDRTVLCSFFSLEDYDRNLF